MKYNYNHLLKKQTLQIYNNSDMRLLPSSWTIAYNLNRLCHTWQLLLHDYITYYKWWSFSRQHLWPGRAQLICIVNYYSARWRIDDTLKVSPTLALDQFDTIEWIITHWALSAAYHDCQGMSSYNQQCNYLDELKIPLYIISFHVVGCMKCAVPAIPLSLF